MSLTRQAGFTLPELLAALVLGGLLSVVLVRSTLTLQRSARAAQESMGLQLAFDGGAGFLASELAELGRGSAGADLLRVASDSLSYRGIRGVGIACHIDAGGLDIPVARFHANRSPQAGRDSLIIFTGIDSLHLTSDGWLALPLLSVSRSTCGGAPAIRLATIVDTNATPLASLAPLVPVRVFEIMQARIYPSLGAWWLGARSESAGETIQPLAGPFSAGSGTFAFRDSLQQPTLLPGAVASVELNFAGRWSGWASGGSSRTDSLRGVLYPRNLSR